MKGNDGRQYKSTMTKKGSHVWIPVSKTRKAGKKGTFYDIHDNGGRPYKVENFPKEKRIVIYSTILDDAGDVALGDPLHKMDYLAIWLGDSESELYGDFEKGNAIILQTAKNAYVAICRANIFRFSLEAGEEIVTFMAPIGNNDVPYPYIIGTKYVYLLLDLVKLPVELVDLKSEPYIQYYGINEFKDKSLKKKATPIKFKGL